MAKVAILYFWPFISIVPFHLVFVVASKIRMIPHLSFYCNYFEWTEISDVSWPPWEMILCSQTFLVFHDVCHCIDFDALHVFQHKDSLSDSVTPSKHVLHAKCLHGEFEYLRLIFIRPFEKRDVLCRGNVRPSVRLSVRPSVRPSAFSGLFFNMLWDINLKLGIYIQ